ncbi:copper resistance protein NlpE N-terminal domain-containing protein [Pontibacter sp. Tf4]|uniref:copper resistance protein NlpE N-terminal domain-containing protein n=1 Tax=Pontibacter sp. Tf4 TaxID=2761620 RepID=UPI00162705E2|nr:copper resistance protein NlpE N-terminal domain-containing protein [Pontibacter sp. Tf4]MBB6612069.1 copper resistance protein NlpE N-terminal domain-containing protein [Pontibacter sp. Tf4]
MKRILTVLVAGATLIVAGCTTSELSTEPVDVAPAGSRLPSTLFGTWSGVIPCADCPGINYNLDLNEDNTFEETMVYQEREVEPYTRTGTWQIRNGVLQLSGPDTTITQFDLSTAGELYMLDQQGRRITSGLAENYTLRRTMHNTEDNSGLWDEKRRLGIDFIATGNEPGWSLEIDLEKGMYFKTLPTETIALQTAATSPEQKGKTTTYRSKSENGELVVEITEQPCEDTMSGKQSSYSVKVTAKGMEFIGCGMYLGESQIEK